MKNFTIQFAVSSKDGVVDRIGKPCVLEPENDGNDQERIVSHKETKRKKNASKKDKSVA